MRNRMTEFGAGFAVAIKDAQTMTARAQRTYLANDLAWTRSMDWVKGYVTGLRKLGRSAA